MATDLDTNLARMPFYEASHRPATTILPNLEFIKAPQIIIISYETYRSDSGELYIFSMKAPQPCVFSGTNGSGAGVRSVTHGVRQN